MIPFVPYKLPIENSNNDLISHWTPFKRFVTKRYLVGTYSESLSPITLLVRDTGHTKKKIFLFENFISVLLLLLLLSLLVVVGP